MVESYRVGLSNVELLQADKFREQATVEQLYLSIRMDLDELERRQKGYEGDNDGSSRD